MRKCRKVNHHVLTTYYVLGSVKSTVHNILVWFSPKAESETSIWEKVIYVRDDSRKPIKDALLSQWLLWAIDAQFHWGPSKVLCGMGFRIVPPKNRRLRHLSTDFHSSLVEGCPCGCLLPSVSRMSCIKLKNLSSEQVLRQTSWAIKHTLRWSFAVSLGIVYHQLELQSVMGQACGKASSKHTLYNTC